MKQLRQLDGEKFEWLTKELQLTFYPRPEYTQKETKKSVSKRKSREASWAIMDEKMDKLREKLEEEKIAFLEHKKNELTQIESELKSLGLEMKPTIEETVNSMELGREVFPKQPKVKRRKWLLEKKFELYGLHSRNRAKDPRIKFTK